MATGVQVLALFAVLLPLVLAKEVEDKTVMSARVEVMIFCRCKIVLKVLSVCRLFCFSVVLINILTSG